MDGTAEALSPVVLNPAGGGDFGRRHVILNGRTSKPMQRASFTGPFSIKSVVTGRATWETAAGRYALTHGRHLILGRGTDYSLTIDGGGPVETFCVFFQDGFVRKHCARSPSRRRDCWTILSTVPSRSPCSRRSTTARMRLVRNSPLCIGSFKKAVSVRCAFRARCRTRRPLSFIVRRR